MTVQLKALYLFLAIAVLLILVFALAALSTTSSIPANASAASRLRKSFAILLGLVLLAALGLTLPNTPYPRQADVPEKVVFVVAKQFAFGLSETPITTEEQWEAVSSSAPLEIPAGALVEFRVTSFDVNHGFGVYTAGGRLLAQTQAMPGYVNRLRLRLDRPGKYPVLCLELCGMQHHEMRGAFVVR